MTDKNLAETIEYLFNRQWDENMPDEEEDALLQIAKDAVSQYGWDQVFAAANDYLHQKCITPDSAINFAYMYWFYRWADKAIPDPYPFLAYFYYRIDWQVSEYDYSDILDSLAISLLPKAGYRDADLFLNPRYMPETDPVMKKEVEKLKAAQS